MSLLRRSAAVPLLAVALALGACHFPTEEERAKAAEANAKKSLIPIDHLALEQKIAPDRLKKIQQELTVIHEYMGAVNGKLDQVTVNSYEAFQRRNDFYPDGMFTEKQLRLLEETAAKEAAAAKQADAKS
jgi:peptidoglycan hydrolase-like protein with peptidoglycan-binding domain